MQEFYNSVPEGYTKGKTKYIVITGSVISGVGKGTFSACLGNLLKLKHGLIVSPVKFDGYLNVDAGTLNPYRHGEVFVLDDGTETDLDLGSYERMLGQNLDKDNYLTAGKIFKTIIDKERAGEYLGRDVQFIPHVTGEIKNFMRRLAMKRGSDVILIEVGGTIGDIENSYFIEAMRELAYDEGRDNVCFINVTYILEPSSLGEFKSKSAQLGLRKLMELGIQPDIVVCRSRNPMPDSIKEKISVASNVPVSRVINMYNLENIYQIPLFLECLGVDSAVFDILKAVPKKPNGEFSRWKELAEKSGSHKKGLSIGITGKYTNVHDSYISILKALEHSGNLFGYKIVIKWIETTEIGNLAQAEKALEGLDGIIVPGGFGERGTEGKMLCIQHAREKDIPFLGLCYGMQLAVVEFARNVCGLSANSTEIDPKTQEPVICILPEQEEVKELGGTMRLGGHDVVVREGTKAFNLYGSNKIRERFRHRYNVNTKYIDILESKGLVFSGFAPQKRIMQILELPEHKFFLASQFHPEFTSRPLTPNPLFKGFIGACVGNEAALKAF